ncbi:MAG: DUF1080 domain-containing protein [Candidatus Heimdallarchaeum aukensis]|uniref:DUF1080 domain-containing protein n=1 Tax=Candidatus Heimdallarchaeum aukensis TaxID=2876573 RepID=A0A9Y1BMQ0_9ARCH|nr:MAG: DUF1080 domain-containing protein [Candidatus Heimdallarchaeum aukensis]
MKLNKLNKRAVSPVIAVVLLIALVTAAVAIVFFVVLPMVQGDPQLVVLKITPSDTDGDKRVDTLIIDYQNLGSGEAVISSIILYKYNNSMEWTVDKTLPYSLKSNKKDVITLTTSDPTKQLKYPDIAYLETTYSDGILLRTDITIDSSFSPVTLIYSEDFNSYSDGYSPTEWTYFLVAQHSPTGTHTINDWQVQSGSLKVMANDCTYIVLNSSTGYYYTNVNMSFDLKANDNDELGIIFRWQMDGGKEKYYLVSYTRDHGLSDHFGGDNPTDGYVTLSYVEDNTITVIDSASFSRNDNSWYNYRLVTDGTSIKVYINDVLYIDTTSSLLSGGYIGLVSAAMNGAEFDNILVW